VRASGISTRHPQDEVRRGSLPVIPRTKSVGDLFSSSPARSASGISSRHPQRACPSPSSPARSASGIFRDHYTCSSTNYTTSNNLWRMIQGGFTYILTNKNRSVLYCGVTSNLAKRMWEHQHKIYPGFTSKYNVDILVYYECHHSIEEAIYREKMIKKKSRLGKIKLIENKNPGWNNLIS
jgi:putative endonuclease